MKHYVYERINDIFHVNDETNYGTHFQEKIFIYIIGFKFWTYLRGE